MNILKNKSGQLLIELLVAIGFGSLLIGGLLSGLMASRDGKAQEAQRLLATPYLRQVNDAMREVRNKNWGGISANGTYNPSILGSDWSLVAGVGTAGGFNQQAIISTVQRNQAGTIVTSGGTSDPATQQIESGVSWLSPVQNGATSTMLFTRYRGNTEVLQTTLAQFNAGTSTRVLTKNTAGGEIQLEGWSAPTTAGTVALPNGGLSVFATGTRAYVGGAAGTNDFSIYNIINPAAPTFLGGLTLNSDVFSIAVYGNFAFVATTPTPSSLNIINISNPAAPSLVTQFNLPGSQDAFSIAISPDGNTVYVGTANNAPLAEFFVIDVTNRASPVILGSLALNTDVMSIAVVGNFAYLATGNAATALTVVNISNPNVPVSAGTFADPQGNPGFSVFATSTMVFLGTRDLSILNVSNPAAITQIGTFAVNGNINSVFAVASVAFLGTSVGAQELKILNVYDYAAPSLFVDVNIGSAGRAAVFQNQHVFVADDNDFRTVLGDIATNFFDSGIFESPTIDPGAMVAFNYLTWSTTTPANTNVRFQVAANSDNSTWSYVGPDGTSATYYVAPGAIPLSIASNRYFRWKAYLSGAAAATPVIQDVTVNYSP